MFSAQLLQIATLLINKTHVARLQLATAESCTGGLLAALLTEVPGASAVFECGFVTYSNAAKHRLLGVPEELLLAHGAVSQHVAEAMTAGVLQNSTADIAVSITGIAGPGGGSNAKPVGLVYIGCCCRGQPPIIERHLFGQVGRQGVRLATLARALAMLDQAVEQSASPRQSGGRS